MQNNTLLQIATSTVFLFFAFAFLNPFHVWMTDTFHMLILGLLVVAFGVFTVFVIREKAYDEREATQRMLAGRAAFLIGATTLLIGIMWQAITGVVDAWLILTLCSMVVAKAGAHVYSERVS